MNDQDQYNIDLCKLLEIEFGKRPCQSWPVPDQPAEAFDGMPISLQLVGRSFDDEKASI